MFIKVVVYLIFVVMSVNICLDYFPIRFFFFFFFFITFPSYNSQVLSKFFQEIGDCNNNDMKDNEDK